MFWIALMLFGLAIALWRYARAHRDEVGQFLSLATALICVLSGLVAAPWPLKISVLACLVFYPSPLKTHDRNPYRTR